MVLEESSLPSEPSTYDAPTFDSDAPPEHVQYSIDPSSLPKPFPILGPLFGFGNARYQRLLTRQIQQVMEVLKRPPTYEETQALAFLVAKENRVISYGVPLGLGAGLWRAYSTRKTWKFPLYKVDDSFNPSSVKIPGGREILKGQAARTFWQLARTSLYGSNGVILGFLLAAPYAASIAAVGTMNDPRLKDYVNATVQRVKEEGARRTVQGRHKTGDETRAPTAGNDTWNRQRTSSRREDTNFDDASPSAGQSMENYQYSSYSEQPSKGTYPGNSNSQDSGRSRTVRQPTTESDSSSGFFDDDDASPTSSKPSQPSSMGGGSAWDRLRRNASDPRPATYGGKQSPRRQGEESSGGDSYSFSGAEEDKQLAKDEAQKDFDARLERERRGGDFGGGGGGRNW